jgi:hypothetical protein
VTGNWTGIFHRPSLEGLVTFAISLAAALWTFTRLGRRP